MLRENSCWNYVFSVYINLQVKYVGVHANILEQQNRLFWRWGLQEVEPLIIFTFILFCSFYYILFIVYKDIEHWAGY